MTRHPPNPEEPIVQSDTAQTTIFQLEVQPETPLRPWHATLRSEHHRPLEFETPLELARHLANLGLEQRVVNVGLRRGLR